MLSVWLHRYPFLRLSGPLVAGIYCGDELIFQRQSGGVASGAFLLLLFSFGLLVFSFFRKRYSGRWLFGVSLFIFCFLLGLVRVEWQLRPAEHVWAKEKTTYRMVITEKPQMKARSVFCRALLTEQIDSVSQKTMLNHKVLLYLSRDSLSGHLRSGDELLVHTRFSPPENNKNPDEFDYARFLFRRQIYAVGFAHTHDWKRVSQGTIHSLRQKALDCREQILSVYHRLGFRGDDFAVLSALTVGYKEELSEDIRESYSVSGASHLLALSGLHIGFLYALLWFCLQWLPGRWRMTMLLRTLLIILFLWAFAFFTGLSASVVRSVVMFSLFALSGLIGRKSFSLNTLLVAAFFMLLCRPSWLFDIGFQLSVCAVAAILLMQSRIYSWFPEARSRLGHYIRGLMSVSIAAQIGTAPLVLFYFSRFSTHFLLTNLLLIPLVSVILYAAVGMLLLTPFFSLQSVVAVGVKGLIDVLNTCVRWVEQLPWASFDGVWLYRADVLGFYLFLLLLWHYLCFRSKKSLILCLSCLLLVCTCHAVMQANDRPERSIVFYNVSNCPVVHCLTPDGHSQLVYADSLPDEARLHKAVSRYWNRLHLKTPRSVTADYEGDFFVFHDRILSFFNRRICMVNDNHWRNKWAAQPLSIDYLYLCKGYDGCLKELTRLFVFHNVILDASLSGRRRQVYEKECRQLGIHFISLSDEGSVRFLL